MQSGNQTSKVSVFIWYNLIKIGKGYRLFLQRVFLWIRETNYIKQNNIHSNKSTTTEHIISSAWFQPNCFHITHQAPVSKNHILPILIWNRFSTPLPIDECHNNLDEPCRMCSSERATYREGKICCFDMLWKCLSLIFNLLLCQWIIATYTFVFKK